MLVINSQQSRYHLGNSQIAGFGHNQKMRWPNRIKELSDEMGWKQAELARITGYDPPVVGRFWHGERKLHQNHLEVFARAFKCTPEEVIGMGGKESNKDELRPTDIALLYAFKAIIRAFNAPKGRDKAAMLRVDFQHALSHYRAENKPGAVLIMDDLLEFVNGPERQEKQESIRRLLQLSPGSSQ